MEADATTPLLRAGPVLGPSAPAAADPPCLNGAQRFAITFFSFVRLLRGLLFLVYPAIALSSFEIPQSGATHLLGALLGSREAILGGLLYTADLQQAREVRRALLANLLSDTADTLILIFSAVASWHWRHPVVEILSAAMLAVLEHLALWSMSGDDEGDARVAEYEAKLQTRENKMVRLDAWLVQLRRAEEMRPSATASPAPSRI